jgi:hypothetical protein
LLAELGCKLAEQLFLAVGIVSVVLHQVAPDFNLLAGF